MERVLLSRLVRIKPKNYLIQDKQLRTNSLILQTSREFCSSNSNGNSGPSKASSSRNLSSSKLISGSRLPDADRSFRTDNAYAAAALQAQQSVQGQAALDDSSSEPGKLHENSLADLEQYVGPEQADRIRADLCENEHTGAQIEKSNRERKYYGVVKFWSNYVPSNTPCEDRRIGSKNLLVKQNSRSSIKKSSNEVSYVFGILDGHGGGWCADVVARRIVDYFMVTQVPPNVIENYVELLAHTQISNTTFRAKKLPYQVRNILTDPVLSERTFELLNAKHKDYNPYWRESLIEFSKDVAEFSKDEHKRVAVSNTSNSLKTAMKRLDHDIAAEADKYASPMSIHYIKPYAEVFKKAASSGCVGTLAVVKQGVCTVAQIGDTRALLGEKDPRTGKWKAVRVTPDHTLENPEEVMRLQEEHPNEEVVIKERVLGVLQPTRAFGDNRLKQDKDWIEGIFHKDPMVRNPVYPDYLTPPYVSNEPDIKRIPLKTETKFLLMATDGFWEQYEKIATPYKKCTETFTAMNDDDDHLEDLRNKDLHTQVVEQKIVEYIGRHMDVSEAMENADELTREQLRAREGLENNLATESIKRALMIGNYGDSDKFFLCDLMNLRAEDRRRHRDDITVTIIKFGT